MHFSRGLASRSRASVESARRPGLSCCSFKLQGVSKETNGESVQFLSPIEGVLVKGWLRDEHISARFKDCFGTQCRRFVAQHSVLQYDTIYIHETLNKTMQSGIV